MADSKITALPENTDPLVTDLLYLIDDPGGTPASQKLAISNLLKFISGLTEDSTPTADAVIAYLNDISGTPVVNKITVPDLRGRQEVLLHDETLASAGSFDVSGISQDYDDLRLIFSLRSDIAGTADGSMIFFNNDTTLANYHHTKQYYFNVTNTVSEGASPFLSYVSAGGAPANSFSPGAVDILDYASTSKLKVAHVHCGYLETAAQVTGLHCYTSWEDGGATAINRIQVRTDNHPTDEFVTGSRLRIIGIKYAS